MDAAHEACGGFVLANDIGLRLLEAGREVLDAVAPGVGGVLVRRLAQRSRNIVPFLEVEPRAGGPFMLPVAACDLPPTLCNSHPDHRISCAWQSEVDGSFG